MRYLHLIHEAAMTLLQRYAGETMTCFNESSHSRSIGAESCFAILWMTWASQCASVAAPRAADLLAKRALSGNHMAQLAQDGEKHITMQL